MEGPYTRADFERMALAEFPELREPFEWDDGRLHLQMHAFTRVAQRAKGEGDWDTYARCVRFAAELWRRPDADLLNALKVSFLEHLDFDGPRGPAAWQHLTPELRDGWRAMRAANERLMALPRKQKGRRR
jgi:hypothetical protein